MVCDSNKPHIQILKKKKSHGYKWDSDLRSIMSSVWTGTGGFPVLHVLQSLSSYCSPYDRPINKRQAVWARNNDFIQKASKLGRWWTHALKNHLAWVRTQASFILNGEGVKWNTSHRPPRGVLISSCPQSFTGGPGRDVSCELNKGILA